MATSAAHALNDMQSNSLGSQPAAMWHAMFKLANAGAVGNTSGKHYTELSTYFATVLGSDHPMLRQYRTQFASQINAEAQR